MLRFTKLKEEKKLCVFNVCTTYHVKSFHLIVNIFVLSSCRFDFVHVLLDSAVQVTKANSLQLRLHNNISQVNHHKIQ